MMKAAADIYAPGQHFSIRCGNCKQASNYEACMRDANGYTLPLSQWRCPRCRHQWALVPRPCANQPGRKYIVIKVIRHGVATVPQPMPVAPSYLPRATL